MSATPSRQPQGQPTGGQFAAKSNPECEVELTAEPDGQAQPVKTVHADGYEEWRLNGELHRDGGPAIVRPDGAQEWFQHGELHRDGGPAIVRPDGAQEWFQHGELHRDGGPAVAQPDGFEMWCQHGRLHRDGGPAITWPDIAEDWYQHGELHRDGGPAVIQPDGVESWYQHGKKIDPPAPSPARLSDDAIRGIINDKGLSPDERIAKLQEALGDPVDTDETG